MQIELSINIKGPRFSRWKNVQKENHRRKGKSLTSWFENGQKWVEYYYLNGKLQNLEGPATTSWFENGQKDYEVYYVNGGRHNTKGPAETRWCSNGQKASEAYYINGTYLTKEEWEYL